MSIELIKIIITALLAFGLWWLYFIEYRKLLIDKTRQKLFQLRDELYDKASSGLIKFDSTAYGITRTTLNGMIQFAHELSLTRLMVIFLMRKIHGSDKLVERYAKHWVKAYSDLSNQASRKAILEIHRKMHAIFIGHIINHSLFLSIVLRSFVQLALVLGKLKSIKNDVYLGDKARVHWTVVDAEANQLGHLRC